MKKLHQLLAKARDWFQLQRAGWRAVNYGNEI